MNPVPSTSNDYGKYEIEIVVGTQFTAHIAYRRDVKEPTLLFD